MTSNRIACLPTRLVSLKQSKQPKNTMRLPFERQMLLLVGFHTIILRPRFDVENPLGRSATAWYCQI